MGSARGEQRQGEADTRDTRDGDRLLGGRPAAVAARSGEEHGLSLSERLRGELSGSDREAGPAAAAGGALLTRLHP
ncbi:hypothetical protein GCM10009663_59910 [Kitasatospora arboriphila]|uniref:Uncharacterized protein n=1 Tax=Kitasatospora arboriphila TaxID=258052 RepID=A0ABP4ELX4_9ACTN